MNIKNLSKKQITWIVTVGLIATGLAIALLNQDQNNQPVNQPDYQAVLPSNKTIDQLGGWQRISPPENDPVFAYADQINGVPINVSQQPLPASFRGNIDGHVAELAKKFNATNKIDAGEITIYQGTSAKGPQSVILAKDGLLIMIKSEQKISDQSWSDYAKLLRVGGADGELELPEY